MTAPPPKADPLELPPDKLLIAINAAAEMRDLAMRRTGAATPEGHHQMSVEAQRIAAIAGVIACAELIAIGEIGASLDAERMCLQVLANLEPARETAADLLALKRN